jgi:hypothetical protein
VPDTDPMRGKPTRISRQRALRLPAIALAIAAAALATGCGDDDSSGTGDQAAPSASDFPAAGGSLQALYASSPTAEDIVVAPASSVFPVGRARVGFGVFTVGGEQITDAQVALYAAPHDGGRPLGPFPATRESLAVDSQFESQTTAQDPDSAETVYVAEIPFSRAGNWDVVALVRRGDSAPEATLVPTLQVGAPDDIPDVGDRPPAIHTPTADDVGGDLAKIDTRAPHDDMHEVDFADTLGKQPVVLLFATPALCQSRVCGPVVDVAEQVKSTAPDDVAFIHMEVYNDNNAAEGLRPQMRAFGLGTEPWLFVIDRDGRVSTRIEGAFGITELEDAIQKVAG